MSDPVRELSALESTTALELILEFMEEGICLTDAELRIRLFNAQLLSLLQLPLDICQIGLPAQPLLSHIVDGGAAFDDRPEHCLPTKVDVVLDDGAVTRAHFRPLPGGGLLLTCRDMSVARDD